MPGARTQDPTDKPAQSTPIKEHKEAERSPRPSTPLAGTTPTTDELRILLELTKSSVNSPATRILRTELEKRSR
jgi:hypothetical protein